jgi:CBS domain-containing protein
MYQVKNAFQQRVISVRPDSTIEDAIQVLLENEVSGAPVIDDSGRLCGIITQFQLLEVVYDPSVKSGLVRDFMTRDVFTVTEDSLLGTAANILMVRRVRRLPVLRHGRVVGIISRSDLLKYCLKTGERFGTFMDKLRNVDDDALTTLSA